VKLLHLFSAPQSVYYFMEHQLQFMRQKGIEVHVILPEDEKFYPLIKEREIGINFHEVGLQRKISPRSDLKSFFSILRVIKNVKPDIIHLHTPKASFLGALAAKLLRRKNVIYHIHGLVSANNASLMNPIYVLEKITCTLADRILCVSDSIMNYALEKGYSQKEKISVLLNGTINGIDYSNRFSKVKVDYIKYSSVLRTKDRFVIGFVGRLSEEKGFFDYLSVMNNLISSNKNLMSVVVGPNESNQKFQEILSNFKNLNTENCIALDEIQDPENVICHFDLLLFPTQREGFGLVAAEANALGIPVVGYDIPGLRDAVCHGNTATLVRYGDMEKLTKAVEDYVNDPRKLKNHGDAGERRVKSMFNGVALRKAAYNYYRDLLFRG